ncbi:MAG TPA: hypothetical protein VJR89_38320, partial [Polyangiales bacterium]|nr:hypothetical protein [Polyangiales bacterium]
GSADLPATLNDSFAQRLEALGPDARDLLEVLCCADGLVLPLGAYRALSAHRDQDRLFRAFEDLVSARILAADSERYRLSQRRFVPVVLAQMSAARTAALRGRLAELLAQNGGDVLDRAQQLMLAGRGDEMVQLLCSLDLQARQPPLALLESAVAHAERTAVLAPRAVHRLRMALLTKASVVVDLQSFRRHLPAATQQLERDSGLELYRELRDVPEAERLTQALSQQQQRYLATPPREQVYSVFDAVRELARLISATCGIASATFDVELLEALPSLEPFLALSPSLRVVEDLKGATLLWHSGGTHRASEIYEQILERITQPDRAGLEEVQVERMQLALQYILALLDASNGSDRAESRAQFLETRRAMRVNAWRVRSLLQLYQGDSAASQKSARRAELLQLQDERESHYLGTSAAFQLYANYLADDLLGVKNAAELIARLAASYPGWQSTSVYAQSCYRYLLGDLDEALQLAEQGLLLARPGRNASWGLLAAQQVRVLRELGQLDRALGHARAYLELADRLQLTLAQRYLCMETSRALGEAGQHAEALAMLEPLLQLIEASGARGLVLGTLYEARAQIAISMGDRAAFELFAERCGQEYKQGNNAALLTKLIRLMERAQQRGLAEAAALPELTPQLAAVEQDHDDNTIVSRMLECVDAADRARCALTMLLQSCDAHLGYLYGASEDKLIALAGLPENTAEPALEGWLQGWVRTERDAIAQAEGVATATVSIVADSAELATETEDLRSATSSDYSDSSGRKFHAVLLTYDHHGKRTIAGVLAIQSDVPRRPPMSQLAMIAAQLLAHHDVRGIALGASA